MENVLTDYSKHEINGVWFECQVAKPKFSENCDGVLPEEDCQDFDTQPQAEDFDAQNSTEVPTISENVNPKDSETSSKQVKSKSKKKKSQKKVQSQANLEQNIISNSEKSSPLNTNNPNCAIPMQHSQVTYQNFTYVTQQENFTYATNPPMMSYQNVSMPCDSEIYGLSPEHQPRRYHSVSDHNMLYNQGCPQPHVYHQPNVDQSYYQPYYQNMQYMQTQGGYVPVQTQQRPQFAPTNYGPMVNHQDQMFVNGRVPQNCYQGYTLDENMTPQEKPRCQSGADYTAVASMALLKSLQRQKMYEEVLNCSDLEKKSAGISESLKIFCFDDEKINDHSTRNGTTSGSEDDSKSDSEDFNYDTELKQLPFITNWLADDEI